MYAANVEPPQRKKKKKNPKAQPPLSVSLFSSLPDEIVSNCLARTSKSSYRSLSLVCKSFHSILSSPEIYVVRSQIGATEPRIYVCLGLPPANHHRWFTLVMNPDQTITSNGDEIKGDISLKRVKLNSSYSPARLNSATVAVGSEIYQIGGTINGKRSTAVDVLDCWSHTWRRAPDMMVSRVHAKSCFLDGKIYVIGGCRKTEESMNWGEVFDIKTQTWEPLPSPSNDDGLDSNHKVAVFGARLYVITKHKNNEYDPKERRWVPNLEHIIGPWCSLEKVMEPINGPWCVIGNAIFSDKSREYRWYSSSYGRWRKVNGLDDLYKSRYYDYRMIKLINYGGKLVTVWDESLRIPYEDSFRNRTKRILCAVIRLEERFTYLGKQKIWGVVERCNQITVPKFYKFLNCLTVSV